MAHVSTSLLDNSYVLFSSLDERVGQLDRDLIDLLSELLTVVVNNTWPRARISYNCMFRSKPIYRPPITIRLSGSVGEKWCPYALICRDVDALYCMPEAVLPSEHDFSSYMATQSDIDHICGYLLKASRPGFYKLVKDGHVQKSKGFLQAWLQKEVSLEPVDDHSLFSWMMKYDPEQALEDTKKHGPAVWITDDKVRTSVPQPWDDKEMDVVPCIKVKTWPNDVMSEFLRRSRPFGWPSKSTLETIASQPCFIVPVGPSNSAQRDDEWRLSSTLAEFELVKSLSVKQRFVFCLWKSFVGSMYDNKETAFCTYHLKTIFFYHCEEHATRCSTVQATIAHLTTTLLGALQTKHCPNFFQPKHNMFSHLDDAELGQTMNVLKHVNLGNEELEVKLAETRFILDLCGRVKADQGHMRRGVVLTISDELKDKIDEEFDTYCKERIFSIVNTLARMLGETENYDFVMQRLNEVYYSIQNSVLQDIYAHVLSVFSVKNT